MLKPFQCQQQGQLGTGEVIAESLRCRRDNSRVTRSSIQKPGPDDAEKCCDAECIEEELNRRFGEHLNL